LTASPPVPTITVYSHADCHLCDTALEVLRSIRAEHDFQLDVVDVRASDSLHRAYFERVPVIALDGAELCDLVVDEPLVRARLLAASAIPTDRSRPRAIV
jgi:glutaredoxin